MANDHGRSSLLARGILIEWLSVVWMIIEAIAAVLAGVLAHSVALIAFGADSVIELVAGGVLLYRLYVEANEGGSERVERAERTASWIVGIALLALAVYIVVSSIVSLFTQSRPEANALGIGIAVASSIIMPFLAVTKKRVGLPHRQQGAHLRWGMQHGLRVHVVDSPRRRCRNCLDGMVVGGFGSCP